MLFPMDYGLPEVTAQSEVPPLNSIFYQPLFPRWAKLRTGDLLKVRWAMDYYKKNSNRWGILRKGHVDILGVINQKRSGISGCSWKNCGISLGLDIWPLEFAAKTTEFSLGQRSQGKSGNLVEDQGKSEKLEIFWKTKKSKKSQENFYPCKFLTSTKKSYAHKNVCNWIVHDNQL